MNHPRPAPLLLAALATGAILLAGCSDRPTTGASQSADASSAASASASPEGSAEPAESQSRVGEAQPTGESAATFQHQGVTVTGGPGETPTITLSEDFAPAKDLVKADIYQGKGDPVVDGATVTTHYVGIDQQNKQVFDSSFARGEPATFPLDQVIVGWQEGLLGMQPGGRRLLIIPGAMAYGEAGSPPAIGPDDTLVFVVDLVSAEQQSATP